MMKLRLFTKVLIFSLAMCPILVPVLAQVQVAGKVLDGDTNDPLPGVSVLVEGTTNGTITDINGDYNLSVATGSEILVFSFIGYETLKVPVENRSQLDINLKVSTTALSEVVVVGYTSQSKQTVTGSIATLDTKKAFETPVVNASEALQGRVAGVSVIAAGQPGDAPIVRVRGFSSPNLNDPLYIVDGAQIVDAAAMADLNPGDIASINILKDAAAASIYGARASNGVIIITTRKGEASQKPTITFDTYLGVQRPTNLPGVLNSQQLGDVIFQSQINDGVTPGHAQYGNGAAPVLPDFINGDPSLPYSTSDNRIASANQSGTNWFDEIFEEAPVQNYYISANGGTEKGRYMMSVGYLNKQGIMLNTDFERFSARANTEFNVKDNVRVGQHLSLSYSEQTGVPSKLGDDNPVSLAYRSNPLVPVFDDGGNFAGTYSTANELGNARNPVAELERAKNDLNRSFRIFGDAYMEVDIIEGLTAKTSIGINYQSFLSGSFTALNPEHSEPRGENALSETDGFQSGWVWTNTLVYEKTFADIHNFKILGGVEALETTLRRKRITVGDFFLEDPDFLIPGAGSGPLNIIPNTRDESIVTTFQKNSLFSVFGQLNYTLKDRYLATFTLRRDESSNFIDNTDIFPALGLGWIISEEAFMNGVVPISNLKLRGSFGELGNQFVPISSPTGDVFILDQLFGSYNFDGTSGGNRPGAALFTVGNPDLSWETSQQLNIGLDIGLLKNDLSLSLDYFQIDTKDLIFAPRLPSTGSIANPPFRNIGTMTNNGIEVQVSYGNFSKPGDFRYDLSLNISTYNNELTDLRGSSFIIGKVLRGNSFTRTQQGQPISSFYGQVVEGIFQNEEEVREHADQGFEDPADGVGRFKYRDVNGDSVINGNDRTFIGNPHPDFTYGFSANLAYKNFDLSLFFQGSQGNDIYNYTRFFSDFPSFFNGGRSDRVLDSWSPENPGAQLPALSERVINGETNPNSYFVEDGSYLRLKNVQLGYNLPKSLLSRIGFSNARVYVQATNLFTITDYEGLDPEIGSLSPSLFTSNLDLGVDFGSFPLAQTYTLGFRVDF
ncbi:TonB-dependent receptor [Fulvivirga sp. M361]|uniref:SusC/RagA family TonB-linked outer membrane protein n=1 Tax=Fulvivirga sp. M361 TaxID=2594266 RepID=UPI001629ADA7|nr:TonB-dependent receptor [Fulvivirga sp. M361]